MTTTKTEQLKSELNSIGWDFDDGMVIDPMGKEYTPKKTARTKGSDKLQIEIPTKDFYLLAHFTSTGTLYKYNFRVVAPDWDPVAFQAWIDLEVEEGLRCGECWSTALLHGQCMECLIREFEQTA